MSNSTIKPIKINPELFKVSNSNNKNKTMKARKNNFKPNLLKQDLLERIKKHRENKIPNLGRSLPSDESTLVEKPFNSDSAPEIISKERNENSNDLAITVENNSNKPTVISNDDDFSQSIDFLKKLSNKKTKSTNSSKSNLSESNLSESNLSESNLSESFPLETKTPTYGCLKNGNLPTFRQIHNTTLKSSNYFENPVLNSEKPTNLVNKKAVTFKYSLGKKHKFVSVLIKNAATRKNISSEHSRLKQTSLTDMKNYLKRHNLLKSGSKAPPDVIKKIYEQSILSGDIRNNNKKLLIHNYLAE